MSLTLMPSPMPSCHGHWCPVPCPTVMDTDAQSHAQLSWTLMPSPMPSCHGHWCPVPCPTVMDTDAQFHAQLSWILTPSPMPNCHGHWRPVPCPTVVDTDAQSYATFSGCRTSISCMQERKECTPKQLWHNMHPSPPLYCQSTDKLVKRQECIWSGWSRSWQWSGKALQRGDGMGAGPAVLCHTHSHELMHPKIGIEMEEWARNKWWYIVH